MYTEWIDLIPIWAVLPLAMLLLSLAIESGYRLGRWRHVREPNEKDIPVGAMVASVLGLVALVLGFTFSLSASRFEARRQVVLEEANAIGTTYLRSSFLAEPERTRMRDLLRQYVDARLEGVARGDIRATIEQSEALHQSLWNAALSATSSDPSSITKGLFIQSLNEVIDLHAKRILVGVRSRIPLVIWFGLIGLALIGMLSVGYQAGLSATRRSPIVLSLVLAFSTVITLIADLDRGQEGLLRVSQQALVDVRQSMHATNDELTAPSQTPP